MISKLRKFRTQTYSLYSLRAVILELNLFSGLKQCIGTHKICYNKPVFLKTVKKITYAIPRTVSVPVSFMRV